MVFKIDLMAVLVLVAFFGIALTIGIGGVGSTVDSSRISFQMDKTESVQKVAEESVLIERAQYVQAVKQSPRVSEEPSSI